jgi:hypothetical protein
MSFPHSSVLANVENSPVDSPKPQKSAEHGLASGALFPFFHSVPCGKLHFRGRFAIFEKTGKMLKVKKGKGFSSRI